MFTVSELADIIEEMTKLDFAKQPNMMFMGALIDELCINGMDLALAREVVYKMEVNISVFDPKDPDWIRIVDSFSVMIHNLHDVVGSTALRIFAPKLSIKYEV